MVARVFEIWRKTSDRRYFPPDGAPDPIPGATQMGFSDLGRRPSPRLAAFPPIFGPGRN